MSLRWLTTFCSCATAFALQAETTVWLDELDLSTMSSDWNKPRAKMSVDNHKITIAGKVFARGVGTHAESVYTLETGDEALSFEALVGVDEEEHVPGKGSVVFRVFADKKLAAESGVLHSGDAPKALKVDLTGVKVVRLQVTDAGDGNTFDHADWADAKFVTKNAAALKPLTRPLTAQLGILTPQAPAVPRINGARVFGVRPAHPVLYTVAATGDRPMTFSAKNLPDGLALDPATGIFSGSVAKPGSYVIAITASNDKGKATRDLRLVVGDRIALTPPMGFNSWNCFAGAVSDEKIRQAADAMVKSGLINHGWNYINIDDFWEFRPSEKNDQTLIGPERDAAGRIQPNKRFPDMKALAAYVHAKGLKIGLYSSPGPTTCGGCAASWQHELQDAQTYAEWGFDYLKYDWCSYGQVSGGSNLKNLMKPYQVMSEALRAQNRDILFSLCQYGMGNVSAWGDKVGGQCWRTTGDITDTWDSMIHIANAQDGLEAFVQPGNWNDPDMLIVGMVGWGHLHPTRLTPNEQYTHMSLWCLFCSPLLIGCDMTQLDAFTLNLLTNDEVLDISQDPLGKAATRISKDEATEVWAKRMEDGSYAVGLVNTGFTENHVAVNFKDLGLSGKVRVRDVWRQQDEGVFENTFGVSALGHATKLIRLFPN
jgi:alpha-galactosidase